MLAIADYKTSNEYYNYAVAWQTGIGCNIAGFTSVFSSEISIMSMFLIAFDMCYNIRYKYENNVGGLIGAGGEVVAFSLFHFRKA